MTRPVLVVQHGDDDPPGRLGTWLTEAGCSLRVVRCHRGEPLPSSLADAAGLVVLGGLMGAYDDAAHFWLSPTKALLREAAERDLPTLGVCLGHQLLAVAAGGRVATAEAPQVGVQPVVPTPAAARDALFAPLTSAVGALHWNNDAVVELPPGAVLLADSEAAVEAFRLGSRVWGIQFHPEVDVETVTGWAGDDVAAGRMSAEVARSRLAALVEADVDLRVTWGAFARRFAEVVRHAQ